MALPQGMPGLFTLFVGSKNKRLSWFWQTNKLLKNFVSSWKQLIDSRNHLDGSFNTQFRQTLKPLPCRLTGYDRRYRGLVACCPAPPHRLAPLRPLFNCPRSRLPRNSVFQRRIMAGRLSCRCRLFIPPFLALSFSALLWTDAASSFSPPITSPAGLSRTRAF